MFRSLQKLQNFMPRRFMSAKVISYADHKLFPPEDGNIIKSNFSDQVVVPELRVDEYVWSNYKLFPDHAATICGITGRRYSYAQLRDRSAKFACALHRVLGVRSGDVVAICLPNLPEWPITSLGSLEVGAVVTPINPIYTAEEIANQLNKTLAKVIITTVEGFPVIQKALEIIQHPIQQIVIKTSSNDSLPPNAVDFHQLIDQQEIFPFENFRTSQDVAILPFSSGTTGLPKGVELTHFNIISNIEQMNGNIYPDIPAAKLATADYQESLPCTLPFFHIYGMVRSVFSTMRNGVKIVTLPKFSPDSFLKNCLEQKATILHVVPPIVIFCANYDGATKKHFEHVRHLASGAAPLKEGDVERFKLKAPHVKIVNGYGLTETSPTVLITSTRKENTSSVGFPTPATQAKVIPTDGSSFKGLSPNEKGEILIRGPQVMRGYLNNPEATKETIVEGNWLRTGDVGYYDENEEFYITDRFKELIKVKGFQVAPAEMEEVIRRHPSVADAAVVGVEHEQSGEVPRAFVVLKKGSEETRPEEIQKFVEEKVAKYKRLEGGVVFIEDIPRTNTGKILRRVIKEKFC